MNSDHFDDAAIDVEEWAKEPTLEKMAEDYVILLNSKPNGWGQYVHPHYGQSHNMLKVMFNRFGVEVSNKAISAAFHERRMRNARRD